MTRAATVKRGGKRPVVKARSRKSAQKTVSAWSKARKAMPVKQDSIERLVTWAIAGMAQAVAKRKRQGRIDSMMTPACVCLRCDHASKNINQMQIIRISNGVSSEFG